MPDDPQQVIPTEAATAQPDAGGSPTTPAAAAGSGTPDRVTTLESRLAGLEARLTEAGRTKTAAEKERDAALAKLADYEAGKLTENEAFQAELKRERERASAAEKAARLAAVEARYPETFAVFGETASAMSDEQLAAAEARFKGVAAPAEPPTPRAPSAQRPSLSGPVGLEEKSLAELRADLQKMDLGWRLDS